MCRAELDLSQLQANTKQTYKVTTGKGRLVVLVTQNPCSGVSISDLGSTSLDSTCTYESAVKKYVSDCSSFLYALVLGHSSLDRIE